MKRISLFIFILLISISSTAQTSEKDLVLKSFETYKNAILNDKGEIAADCVDSRTIKYYSTILEISKNADSLKINSLDILDKLMVLSIKHRTSKEDIVSFNGRDLLIYAIENGMVGKNSVAQNTLGEISVNGDFAKAGFLAKGQKTEYFFHFYKEDQIWKFNLTDIFPIGSKAVQQVIDESGKPENAFLLEILESVTNKKPNNAIWNPIHKKNELPIIKSH